MTITVREWDDPCSWNEFVAASPHAHFQQSWEWGELTPDLGGSTLRLAAVEEGRIVGCAQIAITPVKYTGAAYMYVPRGPVVPEPSVQILGPIVDAARRLAEDHKTLGIKIEADAPAGDPRWTNVLRALGLHPVHPPSQPRSSWVLDIRPDPECLLKNMKQKTRYNIRLGVKKGVEVTEGSLGDLDEFYQLFQETADRDDFFIQSPEFYRHVFQLFGANDNFRLLFARFQGEPVAAVTMLRFGRTCWYMHGASSNRHRNLMATYLLQWEAIQRAREWGCTRYDFRAVPDRLEPDQDMYGVYRFKEGFGGEHVTSLETYAASYRPALFGLWQLFYRARFDLQQWRRGRQGLPRRQFA